MKKLKSLSGSAISRRSEPTKAVSVREYMSMSQSEKGQIKGVRILASKLGDANPFGRIELKLK